MPKAFCRAVFEDETVQTIREYFLVALNYYFLDRH